MRTNAVPFSQNKSLKISKCGLVVSFHFILLLNLWHNQYLDVLKTYNILYFYLFFLLNLFSVTFFIISVLNFFYAFHSFYLFQIIFLSFIPLEFFYSSNYNVIVMFKISFTFLCVCVVVYVCISWSPLPFCFHPF